MKTLQKDLTTGNPGKIIFNFTLPIFLSLIHISEPTRRS